ncbi:MAG: hypothetical protein KDH20_06670 [Rhodocyclaceae bacterium]|nr:hypothetical protein [Rhodocyclaceae bacterium]
MPAASPPITTVFDTERVSAIIEAAATAMATQMSLTSEWKPDDSWQSRLIYGLETINPVSGFYNLIAHDGNWRSERPGAQVTSIDQTRRTNLRAMCVRDYWNGFKAALASPGGAGAAYAYLLRLVNQTKVNIQTINAQFQRDRDVNNKQVVQLNDALDRAYRIRTAASVAFMVVGALPLAGAAAGTTTVASFSLVSGGSCTLAASAAAPWALTLQVAGVGGLYGFLTDLAFNAEDVRRSAAVATAHPQDAAKGGAIGAGGNLAQAGVEQMRQRGARQIADAQRQAANRAAVSNAVRDTMHQARSGRPINPRLLNNEVQRGVSQRLAEHAEKNLARRAQAVARSGSVIFIAAGLYSMREDIALAMKGLTAGTDRTR